MLYVTTLTCLFFLVSLRLFTPPSQDSELCKCPSNGHPKRSQTQNSHFRVKTRSCAAPSLPSKYVKSCLRFLLLLCPFFAPSDPWLNLGLVSSSSSLCDPELKLGLVSASSSICLMASLSSPLALLTSPSHLSRSNRIIVSFFLSCLAKLGRAINAFPSPPEDKFKH